MLTFRTMLFLTFLIFIPNINSKVLNPTNNKPWDAYEYAKNISMQLSNELFLNMNQKPISPKLFREYYQNGIADYKGNNFSNPDNSIRNGSFSVASNDNQTVIEFVPNFRNFSIKYEWQALQGEIGKLAEKTGPMTVFFDYVPINVRITRQNRNGEIETQLNYPDAEYVAEIIPARLSFKTYIYQKFNEFEREKKDLGHLNEILKPQLKNIVESLPFPTENITESHWKEISLKMNVNQQKKLHGPAYEYAENVSIQLKKHLFDTGENLLRNVVNISLPSNLLKDGANENVSMACYLAHEAISPRKAETSIVKPESFSVEKLNNTTIMKFAPNYHDFVLRYFYNHENAPIQLVIRYKNIPVNVEIEHRKETDEKTAKVVYGEMKETDFNVVTWYSNRDDIIFDEHKIAGADYLIKKFFETPEFRKSLCDLFEPENTFLQTELNEILKKMPALP